MYSSGSSLLSISLKQYLYKLKANTGLVNRLIITQIIALIFSLAAGSGMASSSNETVSVSVRTYSASIVIVFSLFWITTFAILLTIKQYKKMEMPLVGNRLSGSLSDVGLLLSASVFAGITSSLVSVLLRVIMYFSFDRTKIVSDGFSIPFSDLLLGMVVAILYMCLVSAMSYFVGMLAQDNLAFLVLIPIAIYGSLRVYNDYFFAQSIYRFYVEDVSLAMFALKVIITSISLFGVSMLLSNRMEVGK
jgi:hypothetical protein